MLTLSESEVCVWQASLNPSEPTLARLEKTLASDEQKRADRYAFPHLRRRFVATRGILRSLLGAYTGLEAHTIRFCYGNYGKPTLDVSQCPKRLCFNLSHSEDTALFAFAWERELGVDIECIQPHIAIMPLAQQFFSKREYQALSQLPPDQRLVAFYACWTRKEAYIKAQGVGLSTPLNRFAVSVSFHEPARLLSVEDSEEEPLRWRLQALSMPPEFCATVAVFGHDWTLKQAFWEEEAVYRF